jgi:hypothetical protein
MAANDTHALNDERLAHEGTKRELQAAKARLEASAPRGRDWTDLIEEMAASLVRYPEQSKKMRGLFVDCLDAAPPPYDVLPKQFLDGWMGDDYYRRFTEDLGLSRGESVSDDMFQTIALTYYACVNELDRLNAMLDRLTNLQGDDAQAAAERWTRRNAFERQQHTYLPFRQEADRVQRKVDVRIEGFNARPGVR